MHLPAPDRLARWRLLLGEAADEALDTPLDGAWGEVDRLLGDLYDAGDQRGLGSSHPQVHRWLGDIRTYFPAPVVQVMQQDAWDRLGLARMLLEPEVLASIEPDVRLVATLLNLRQAIPAQTQASARILVARVVEQLRQQLRLPLVQAVQGALSRTPSHRRPRHREIDWHRTIRANLRHYQPELGTIIPQRLYGFARQGSRLKDLILCVDQSGSMAQAIVYAGIYASVLASLPTLRTRLVLFDTAVVDLSDQLGDPVELLFGVQLGGGTDIGKALAYCQTLVQRPADTTLLLISDLLEGGSSERMLRVCAGLRRSGVRMACLLTLSDEGRPVYDHDHARALGALGIPAFACTPGAFPALMARALRGEDLAAPA
ncbi:MAG: VWA domain-containing protein [Bacteroidia bacterium]